MQFAQNLSFRAEAAEIAIPAASIPLLEAYFELLRKWNRKMSLTSLPIESYEGQAIDRILLEPLAAAAFMEVRVGLLPVEEDGGPEQTVPARRRALNVLDIGSGGGSPAIPLKIARPDISITLIESKSRKAAFLREVARQLALERVTVECARYEELLNVPELVARFDLLTVRAVRIDDATLCSLQRFLKPGGTLMWFQSDVSQTEGAQASAAGQALPVPLKLRASHLLVRSSNSKLVLIDKASV